MLALTARLKLIGLRPKEVGVSASVLYMLMSPDGYIAGPNDGPDNPGGDGFGRLVIDTPEATHVRYRVRR